MAEVAAVHHLQPRNNSQMAAVLHWALVPVPAVYDVTRRETFESLEEIWMREVDLYSTVDQAVKMVVANKVDKVSHSCLRDK